MKIAIVSLDQVWEDKDKNFHNCLEYIKLALKEDVKLIIFPEMTLTGFSTNISYSAENKKESITLRRMSKLAKDNKIAILFGAVIKSKSRATNNSFFISDKGKVIGQYTKIHPFTFANEDKYFKAGKKLEIVTYKNYNFGLTICYDLRFPELYSSLSKKSDVIINIANWPKLRLNHWETLLKARAIENQIYLVGVNRTGIDGNNLEYEESSNIFDANGDVLSFKGIKDMKVYDINKDFTRIFKDKFNTTNDRKIKLYKNSI
ncbi:nitrilase-related carbon-nitrogen hydrolase [Sulfurimonas sp.]|uniref:nitrilase-related carbon-nitrogen hydrolase n=1 Tax=Sulfurimonas sp. TaxID=2022749 RepID=UPI0025E6A516|nr:nitrilase-related carbon-nitrogen hydrolase [Sulfurimonas sp.]